MSAKSFDPTERKIKGEIACLLRELERPVVVSDDFTPLELLAATATARAAKEAAEAKAAARRRSHDAFNDPLAASYHGSSFVDPESLDESDDFAIHDDDDDWQDGDNTAGLDRFLPKRKSDAKSDDAKGVGVAPKGSPLSRLLKTSDSSGGRDHEPATRRTTPMEKFLEPKKRNAR